MELASLDVSNLQRLRHRRSKNRRDFFFREGRDPVSAHLNHWEYLGVAIDAAGRCVGSAAVSSARNAIATASSS